MATLTFEQATKLEPKTSLNFEEAQKLEPKPLLSFEEAQRVPSSGVTIAPKGGVPREGTEQEAKSPTFNEAFERAFTNRALNSVLSIPKIPSRMDEAARGAAGKILGLMGFETARELLESQPPNPILQPPADLLPEDIRAVPGAVTGEGFGEAREREIATSQQFATERPGATALGQAGADIASLALGRGLLGVKSAARVQAKGFNEVARQFRRGEGKAAEVAIETAIISLLQGGDPVLSGVAAGGMQVGGSMALKAAKFPFEGFKQLVISAGGLFVLAEMARALAPGFEQNAFSSKDFAIEKLAFGVGTGILAAVLGAGRTQGSDFSTKFPIVADRVADFINVGLRGGLESFWSQITEAAPEERDRVSRGLKAISENPELFTPDEQSRIESALQSGEIDQIKNLFPN